ncbi:preprotein translocase subunit SecE [Clostridiaceae bacterium]|nr:preprotein translocase subunit SecE [Clostridiaceae bacterium]RKI15337.1 preprotein translocase subunit SecE [bacterium 1XD21-70]
MAEATKTEKAPKPSFIKGLKAEFKKIVWPNQETVIRQSATVVVVTVLLGTVIALLDFAITKGLNIILFLG